MTNPATTSSPLAALHLDGPVRYDRDHIVPCSCGEEFRGLDPDDADVQQLEHAEQFLGSQDELFSEERAIAAARRAAQTLRWDGNTTPNLEVVQDAITDLIWLAHHLDADEAKRIEERARFIQSDEAAEASGVFTVIGLWSDDVPLVAGAIVGEHEVSGDLGYHGYQPWATAVEASDFDGAMAAAIKVMREDIGDDEEAGR